MSLPPLVRGARARLLAGLMANGLLQAGLTVGLVLLIRYVFDHHLTGDASGSVPALWSAAAGVLLTAATLGVARGREIYDAERLAQDYIRELRLCLFDHLAALPWRTLQRRRAGGVLLRFVGDLAALRLWLALGLARGAVAAVSVAGALLALAWLSLALAGVLCGLIFALAVLLVLLGPRLQAATRRARRRQARLAANVGEKLHAMALVQLCNRGPREAQRFVEQSERLRLAMVERARLRGAMRGSLEAAAALGPGLVLAIGAAGAPAGAASAGVVAAAMAVAGLLLHPLRNLARSYEYWQGARVSREQLQRFLATPRRPDPPGQPALAPGGGSVRFHDVVVSGSLRGVTAVAPAGARVAVVGPNGSGKSSLLALAARLIDPDSGTVLIDGQDLRSVSLASVHAAVALVAVELPLLRGSVSRNLRYRSSKPSAETLAQVSAWCDLDQLLSELPDGAATRLHEGGSNLSAGQRMRIALARALLGAPAVLLLDEVDAHLDAHAAQAVDRVLAQFPGTVIMATHRPQRLRQATLVWHVDAGVLVESGAPAALPGDGPTARLFGVWSPKPSDEAPRNAVHA